MDIILKNLEQMNPGDGFYFKSISKWVFPDKYIHNKRKFYPIVALYKDNHAIGLISFNNSPFKNKITINFIQGIKQSEDGVNFKTLNKAWFEIIMDSFIIASIPLIEKGKSIVFKLSNYDKNEYITSIEKTNKLIKQNNNFILKLQKELLFTKRKVNINLLNRKIRIYQKSNIDLENRNKVINGILKSYGVIRDRYFTKEGLLNQSKLRVSSIFESYKIQKKNKKPNLFLKLKKIVTKRK